MVDAQRLAVHDVGCGLAAFRIVEVDRNAGRELHGRAHGAAMGVDHQSLTVFGEVDGGFEAGDVNREGQRHPRAAPHGFRYGSSAHQGCPSCGWKAPLCPTWEICTRPKTGQLLPTG